MTHDTPTNFNSPLSLSGEPAGVFTGVFSPAAEVTGHGSRVTGEDAVARVDGLALDPCPVARDSSPLVVAQAHGILTGKSSPSWPEFGSAFFAARYPHVATVNTEYFELPLPRLAAVRNPARSRRLVRRLLTAAQYRVEMREEPAEIAFVSHSNGAVLAMQACRELIAQGIAVRSLIMIAPAVRTKDASSEVAKWLDTGMLDYALLVQPMADTLIGGIARNWRTKLVAWPWGSLGSDGWDLSEIGDVFPNIPETIALPDMGHTDPVSVNARLWLYESIIAPALGLAPWGGVQPNGEVAV